MKAVIVLLVSWFTLIKAQEIEVGDLPNFQHGISGTLKFRGVKTLVIEDFSYDGQGPEVFLYYYPPGVDTNRNGGGEIIPVSSSTSEGQFVRGRRYNEENLVLTLPDDVTACNIGTLTMWCRIFEVFFTAIEIPRSLFVDDGVDLDECALVGGDPTDPSGPGPVLINFDNCQTLDSSAQVSWSMDREKEEITFELCSCEATQTDTTDYVAFGVSGSDSSVLMFGADATVAWVDDTGGNAVDYHLSGYFQCRGGSGACPDVLDTRACTDDVTFIAGSRVNGRQCITYKRGYSSGDSTCDLAIDPDKDVYVVWGVGPLGETAFRHARRASRGDPPLKFGREPTNNCLQTIQCRESCDPFEANKIVALHDETFVAQIGPSALDRGYTGITGRAAWGIAWYINGTLIPELTVERGRTYTFIVEGGDDPDNLARYHPLYITDSISGGWTLQSSEQQMAEKRFAGFDEDDNPTAVGRHCNLMETTTSRTLLQNCDASEEEYTKSLQLICDEENEASILMWTPDENTPDLVYYQCAVHLNLGWKIHVMDAPVTTETPSTSTTTETPSTPATSPTTETPATSPTTETAATLPTTETPSTPATLPTTETPATSPTTEMPSTPATLPTTETPATSPTTEMPSTPAPETPSSPATSPTTETPATSPTTETPSTPATAPTTETPSTPATLPTIETPSTPATLPTTETPATSPTTETPSTPATSPTTETPSTFSTSPTTETPSTPSTSPTTETPSTPATSPTTEMPSTPTTETPATLPTTEPSTPATEKPTELECPTMCTYEYCNSKMTRTALCSNPHPSASSNCTQCHVTNCRVCYNSMETITSLPGNCGMCSQQEVVDESRCYRRWIRCIRRANAIERVRSRDRSQDNFACYNAICAAA